MRVLAVDLGSTQWKAAVGNAEGLSHCAKLPAPFAREANGFASVPAQAFQRHLVDLIRSLPADARARADALSITGMAEGGVLLDRGGMLPLTPVVPWFDTRSVSTFERLMRAGDLRGRYQATGLPPSHKYGVFRILDWLERLGREAKDVCWLGVVEYAAHWLTGLGFTVPSLAARTYAYRLDTGAWDEAWLQSVGIPLACLPSLDAAESAKARLRRDTALETGLRPGIPVFIAGHDHLCAAFGAGALCEDALYGSLGTALTLIAQRPMGPLSREDIKSGLSFGPSLAGEGITVLGSIQSGGASVAWLKDLLYPRDGYAAMLREADALPKEPGQPIFFPYLSGSGAPHLNPNARGSFIGLGMETDRARLAFAVYEGIAMETRFVLARLIAKPVRRMIVSGGLCAHLRLLQAMAEVCGLTVQVSAQPEGTLDGAIRLALQDAGAAGIPAESLCGAVASNSRRDAESGRVYAPTSLSGAYQARYREAYLPLMDALSIFARPRLS